MSRPEQLHRNTPRRKADEYEYVAGEHTDYPRLQTAEVSETLRHIDETLGAVALSTELEPAED